jgi:hypothetical protein
MIIRQRICFKLKIAFAVLIMLPLTNVRRVNAAELQDKPVDQVQAFKAFVETPPAILKVVWERSNPDQPSKGSNFFTGRWQQNAALINVCKTREAALQAIPDTSMPRIVSRYGTDYWHYYDKALTFWIDKGRRDEANNQVWTAYVWELSKLASVINLGITYVEIGALRWQGTSFTYNNPAEGRVSGSLKLSEDGKVSALRIHMDLKDPAYAEPRPFDWEIEYQYDRRLGIPHLPSSFRYYLLSSEGAKVMPLDKVTIYELTAAEELVPKAYFEPQSYVKADLSNSYYISGQRRTYVSQNGVTNEVSLIPGDGGNSSPMLAYRTTTLGFAAIVALSFILLRRQSKNKQK